MAYGTLALWDDDQQGPSLICHCDDRAEDDPHG